MHLQIHKKVVLALRLLELEHQFVQTLQQARNPNEIGQAIEKLKVEAKEKAKQLARVHHPDHGGDQEKMKEINAAVTDLHENKHYVLCVPRPQPVVRIIHVQTSMYTNSSTTTTYSGTSYY